MKNKFDLNDSHKEIPVSLIVNGREVRVMADQFTTLDEILRDQLHLTGASVNHGYNDCHLCAVLVDGREVCSNHMAVVDAAGKEIVTVEGLLIDEDLEQLKPTYFNDSHPGFSKPGRYLTF